MARAEALLLPSRTANPGVKFLAGRGAKSVVQENGLDVIGNPASNPVLVCLIPSLKVGTRETSSDH